MRNIISLVNAVTPQIIEQDDWLLIENLTELDSINSESKLILPFKEWLSLAESHAVLAPSAFWLDNDTDVRLLEPWLEQLELIAFQFPKFTDGRAYSQAVELRTHIKWQGEIRAVGDVLRDQLTHMHRCGFNSFAVREDKNVEDAVKGLSAFSTRYSGSAIEPEPLFRRRTAN